MLRGGRRPYRSWLGQLVPPRFHHGSKRSVETIPLHHQTVAVDVGVAVVVVAGLAWLHVRCWLVEGGGSYTQGPAVVVVEVVVPDQQGQNGEESDAAAGSYRC